MTPTHNIRILSFIKLHSMQHISDLSPVIKREVDESSDDQNMSQCVTRVKAAKKTIKHAVGVAEPESPLPPDVPATMQAVIVDEYLTGDTSVDNVLHIDPSHNTPHIEVDQVLIRVHAAAINPMDVRVLKGILSLVAKKPPMIPGRDVSGVVVHVGTECKRLQVGDEVFADASSHFGTFAEYVALPEDLVCVKPRTLTHVEAAAIPLAGLTAYKSLVVNGQFARGQKVLILGASGGVGTLCVQMAKKLGALYIACTCSPRNFDLMSSLGADQCVDYNVEQWWDVLAGEQVDLIIDCVGGKEQWANADKVLRPKYGRFVTLVGDNVQPSGRLGVTDFLKATTRIINRKFWSLIGYSNYDLTFTPSGHELLQELAAWCNDGELRPIIDKTFHINGGLDAVRSLYEMSMNGHTRGKAVLEFTDLGAAAAKAKTTSL